MRLTFWEELREAIASITPGVLPWGVLLGLLFSVDRALHGYPWWGAALVGSLLVAFVLMLVCAGLALSLLWEVYHGDIERFW